MPIYGEKALSYYYEPLKECPFCKGEKLTCKIEYGDFLNGYIARIDCVNCGGTQGWKWGETIKEACYHANKDWNCEYNIRIYKETKNETEEYLY